MRRRAGQALAEIAGAPFLAAVALLVVNDQLLKPIFHDAVTGKLSDVAICFLLPLLLSALLGLFTPWRAERRLEVGAAIAVALFSLLEMSDLAGALFSRTLTLVAGPLRPRGVVLTRDPTDLLALLMVPLAVAHGRRRIRSAAPARRWSVAAGALALGGAACALMATSPAALCDRYTAPVVFQAEAGCGPGGLIVVDGEGRNGRLSIADARALGLPPLDLNGGGTSGARGTYTGASCPFTLAGGEWEVMVTTCAGGGPSADASADAAGDANSDAGADADAAAGGPPAAACAMMVRRCQAGLEGAALWFSCDGGDAGLPSCRSRLTVLP